VTRSLRGLYAIRGGFASPSLAERVKPDVSRETEPEQDAAPADELGTLRVDFSVFDVWYRISSAWEGIFMERVSPGAFKKTLAERGGQTKILFNHGQDLTIGDKPLAVASDFGETKNSAFLEGALLDTSYNRDLAPGLRVGAYGASFMFEALGENWDYEPEASASNPEGLPERTITEVRLMEAGPVTWPANPAATAGLRSGASWFGEELRSREPDRYDDLVRTYAAFRALNGLSTPIEIEAVRQQALKDVVQPTPEPGRHSMSKGERNRRLFMLTR